MNQVESSSLEQRNAVQNISEGSLVPLGVIVVLAVACTHLDVHVVSTMRLSRSNVFTKGSTGTEVGDLCIGKSGTFLINEHLKCLDVPLSLQVRLSLVFLRLHRPFGGFRVIEVPPLLFFLLIGTLAAFRRSGRVWHWQRNIEAVHVVFLVAFLVVKLASVRKERQGLAFIQRFQVTILSEPLKFGELVHTANCLLAQLLLVQDSDALDSV